MSIKIQKKELRDQMLAERKDIKPVHKRKYDRWICSELDRIIGERNSEVVHAYIPLLMEINIAPLLRDLLKRNITVVCPKALPKRVLHNRVLTSFDDLEKGVMGTQHPANPEEYTGPIDLVIVPGLAFDSDRYRIGYGGAYYDTFLAKYPDAHKVGIFYPFQKVEHVPREDHDLQLDDLLVGDWADEDN